MKKDNYARAEELKKAHRVNSYLYSMNHLYVEVVNDLIEQGKITRKDIDDTIDKIQANKGKQKDEKEKQVKETKN